MYNLYHHFLDPFSRKVRVLLAEKGLDFNLIEENFWERRKKLITINPAGTVPVLENASSRIAISPSSAIVEYILEKHPIQDLMEENYLGKSLADKAEARRIQAWFDEKFYDEVGFYILSEKVFNSLKNNGSTPNSAKIRAAKLNLETHLDYMEFLLQNRTWLAGECFTIADITAAAHLSCLDYLGDIFWTRRTRLKEWYALVKSKKGFQPLLKDRILGFPPARWYAELDF